MGWDDAATRFPADSEYVRSAELVIAIRPTASLGGRASADLPSCDSGARRRSEIKIDGRRTPTHEEPGKLYTLRGSYESMHTLEYYLREYYA